MIDRGIKLQEETSIVLDSYFKFGHGLVSLSYTNVFYLSANDL